MRQLKVAAAVLAVSTCFITLLLYYWHRSSNVLPKLVVEPRTAAVHVFGTPMRHMNLDEIYKDHNRNDEQSLEVEEAKQITMINTPGCKIPVAMVDYEKYLDKNKGSGSCGRRAVFLKKVREDRIHVTIKPNYMKKYLRKSAVYHCCYRFIRKAAYHRGHGKTKIQYTPCKKVEDDDTVDLEDDFINIKCFELDKRNVSHAVYDDVFAFTKKIYISESKRRSMTCKHKYNILILGMDSMSLPRFVKTMVRTTNFFEKNFWLSYRGYNKIGDNTFPNLMAALSGFNLSTLYEKCAKKMDQCNDLLIWNIFKKDGYVTAYGEDYLRLPDTFNDDYAFRNPPTDHYMRPLFAKGETELNNKSLVCAGKIPSGRQLLDYALDFVLTYRTDNFFGFFWMNSYSHNINSRPQDADKIFENFFNQLSYTGILEDTFIIFFSDHGIRFGEHRFKMESYYDERLPFMFMWTPMLFKARHPFAFKSLAINQFRLITPYDMYNTFREVSRISTCNKDITESAAEACPKCQSIFKNVSGNRTCDDAAIQDKWCSCHKLYPLGDIQDDDGLRSVLAVVSHIKSTIKTVKTKRCWACMSLSLKNVIRMHFYHERPKTYHVVAFSMKPGNVSYEATVMKKGESIELVGLVSVISPYRGLGKCTIHPKDRLFCVCQKIENCRITS